MSPTSETERPRPPSSRWNRTLKQHTEMQRKVIVEQEMLLNDRLNGKDSIVSENGRNKLLFWGQILTFLKYMNIYQEAFTTE